jgi:hypothetical protein
MSPAILYVYKTWYLMQGKNRLKIEEPDSKVLKRIFGSAKENQQEDKYCMTKCVIHFILLLLLYD